MKIGVYKPYKPIFFHENTIDDSGWSIEVVNFVKMLERYCSAPVCIYSETDEPSYKLDVPLSKNDVLFVFNGRFDTKDYEWISAQNCTKVLMLSDMGLAPKFLELFDAAFTQSITQNALDSRRIKEAYYPIHELICYEAHFPKGPKTVQFAFMGNERNRLADLLEYVIRPGVEYHGKSKTLGIDSKISFVDAQILLSKTKYSIVIADPQYYDAAFLTQRFWECCINNVVAFVHEEYDSQHVLIDEHDYRRVKNYVGLSRKLRELEEQDDLREFILKSQREQVRSRMDGSYHYELLSQRLGQLGVKLCSKKKN